jgi:hypothetical protein
MCREITLKINWFPWLLQKMLILAHSTLVIYADGKKRKKIIEQNKGQKTEVRQFIEAILNGTGEVIPFEEIHSASLATFKIIESIRAGECLRI